MIYIKSISLKIEELYSIVTFFYFKSKLQIFIPGIVLSGIGTCTATSFTIHLNNCTLSFCLQNWYAEAYSVFFLKMSPQDLNKKEFLNKCWKIFPNTEPSMGVSQTRANKCSAHYTCSLLLWFYIESIYGWIKSIHFLYTVG